MRCRQVLPVMVVILVPLALLTGCQTAHSQSDPALDPVTYKPDTVDPWLVEALAELPADKAVVRQHTLFAHDFVEYGAVLNELGRRHLEILIRHYRQYPGPLNVRRGDASKVLYDARVAAVRDALAAGGVNVQQVEVGSGLPGGEGLSGEYVLVALQEPMRPGRHGQSTTVTPLLLQQGSSK